MVRAVAADAPGREIPGAVCDAVSPYFVSRFPAPARLLIPVYGSQTPAVTVTCEGGGASGRATVAPQASYSGGGFGGPAVGISVGTGGGWNGWDGDGVGLGLSWWGGGGGYGQPVVSYPAPSVPCCDAARYQQGRTRWLRRQPWDLARWRQPRRGLGNVALGEPATFAFASTVSHPGLLGRGVKVFRRV